MDFSKFDKTADHVKKKFLNVTNCSENITLDFGNVSSQVRSFESKASQIAEQTDQIRSMQEKYQELLKLKVNTFPMR